MAYFVYILRTPSNTLYIGQTSNLKKRIFEHNFDKNRSAKYLRGKTPVKLVYSEKYSTLQEAMEREWQLKKWTKKKKEALVSGGLIKRKQ